jgi:uncharacterized protein (DUF2147 family)
MRAVILACGLFPVIAAVAHADGVAGMWLDGAGDAAIALAACGDSLCGRIVWLRDPLGPDGRTDTDRHNRDAALRARPLCGLPLIGGFRQDGDASHWRDGWIYDPDSGDTYRATLTLREDGTLAVRGYVGIPLFGRTETWTRPRRAPPACAAG